MEGFWSIIREWYGIGQFIFMLGIFGAILTIIKSAFFYVNVFMHGWPPPGTPFPSEDELIEDED